MAGSGRRYTPEFKARMVELVRAGRSPDRLAKEFEPSATAIRRWVEQADRDEGLRKDGLTTAERKEVRELLRDARVRTARPAALPDRSRCAEWRSRESRQEIVQVPLGLHDVPFLPLDHIWFRRTEIAEKPHSGSASAGLPPSRGTQKRLDRT